MSLILDESELFPDVDDEYESSSSLSLFAQDVINKMLIVRMNKFFIFQLDYEFHANSYVHEKEKFMTFRNIPLRSALFWDSVDTNYDCKINVYGKKEGLSNEY